jgi:CBS-domain-containing membrane protein
MDKGALVEAGAPTGEALNVDMTLEDALSWSAERGGALPVQDASGKVVGVITPERLAAALSGEHSGNA